MKTFDQNRGRGLILATDRGVPLSELCKPTSGISPSNLAEKAAFAPWPAGINWAMELKVVGETELRLLARF
jgi:hypothetical protein